MHRPFHWLNNRTNQRESLGRGAVPLSGQTSNCLQQARVYMTAIPEDFFVDVNGEDFAEHKIVISMLDELDQFAFEIDRRLANTGRCNHA